MKNKILKIICFLFVIILGGLIAQQLVWPFLVQYSFFARYDWKEPAIYNITEREEYYIQESVALEKSIERVEKAVIGVKTITPDNQVLEGSGLILTSNGIAITLAELIPLGSSFSFYIESQPVSFQVLKRDLANNLALIKIEGDNLRTLSFANQEKLKLGERVFLYAFLFDEEISPVVNEGIIRSLNENLIETNIVEEELLLGSPLFNIEGQFLGLNCINKEGRIVAIPVNKIRDFTGF